MHFDVEVRQAETFGSQLVEPGRRRSPDDSATVEAGLTPTKVVQKDEHDVRFVLGVRRRCNKQNDKNTKALFDVVRLLFPLSLWSEGVTAKNFTYPTNRHRLTKSCGQVCIHTLWHGKVEVRGAEILPLFDIGLPAPRGWQRDSSAHMLALCYRLKNHRRYVVSRAVTERPRWVGSCLSKF